MLLSQLPNALTLARLLAAPFLGWLLWTRQYQAALIVVLLAGITDWLDGFAARRFGVMGKLGVLLDPLADKTLLVTLFLALAAVHLIASWLLLLVIGRDLIIVAGSLLLRIFRNIRKFTPSILGKVSTFFQIVLVLLVLTNAAFHSRMLRWLELTAISLATVFTALSGIDYIRRGVGMARRPPVP